MATLGTVVAVNGEAFVVDQSGNKRIIQLGDTIQPGDTIITPPGIIVELQMVNGRTIHISGDEIVKFTQELIDAIQPGFGDSAVDQATIQSIIQAIEEGRDIGSILNSTDLPRISSIPSKFLGVLMARMTMKRISRPYLSLMTPLRQ